VISAFTGYVFNQTIVLADVFEFIEAGTRVPFSGPLALRQGKRIHVELKQATVDNDDFIGRM
jgi:hypothetical protein